MGNILINFSMQDKLEVTPDIYWVSIDVESQEIPTSFEDDINKISNISLSSYAQLIEDILNRNNIWRSENIRLSLPRVSTIYKKKANVLNDGKFKEYEETHEVDYYKYHFRISVKFEVSNGYGVFREITKEIRNKEALYDFGEDNIAISVDFGLEDIDKYSNQLESSIIKKAINRANDMAMATGYYSLGGIVSISDTPVSTQNVVTTDRVMQSKCSSYSHDEAYLVEYSDVVLNILESQRYTVTRKLYFVFELVEIKPFSNI